MFQSLSAASNSGYGAAPGAGNRNLPPTNTTNEGIKVRMVPGREGQGRLPLPPPHSTPMQIQQVQRSSYPQGFNFSDVRFNMPQPSYNFAGPGGPHGQGKYILLSLWLSGYRS